MADGPIDAETALTDGTLTAVVKGTVDRYQRTGAADRIIPDIAVPLVRLAARLVSSDDRPSGDNVLRHAVHDGVTPTNLVAAVAVDAATDPGHYTPLTSVTP
jgi:hypothetical protein